MFRVSINYLKSNVTLIIIPKSNYQMQLQKSVEYFIPNVQIT